MNATLVTALIGLAGLVLGSSTTIAALSPASRRLKRLAQLVELRSSVEDVETRRRIDYATERLAHQIAEDAVMSGDRLSARLSILHWLAIISGVAWAFYVAIRVGDEPGSWYHWAQVIVALLVAGLNYFKIMSQFQRSPQKISATVEVGINERRNHQGRQSARAEGSPEGDVPAS